MTKKRNNKQDGDARFALIFDELKEKSRVDSAAEFARILGITTLSNIHQIFRSGKGETTSVRHINDEIIAGLVKHYSVNENYVRNGVLPMFSKRIKTKPKEKYKSSMEAIRKELGITQVEMGEIIGRDQSRIVQYENNIHVPSIEVAKILRTVLDIPYDFIIDFTGDVSILKKAKLIYEKKFKNKKGGRK